VALNLALRFVRGWKRTPAPSTDLNEVPIIATQRTGSNFLCDCLGAFSRALELQETFTPSGALGANKVRYVVSELGPAMGLDVAKARIPHSWTFFGVSLPKLGRRCHTSQPSIGAIAGV
jgi:hypothetical protein